MDFQERFATEQACREYLFASRWPDGFVCPRCAGGQAGAMHRRRLVWQCKRCGAQTSGDGRDGDARDAHAAAHVVWAAYLVATHHPGISAKQLQRQLSLSRYETAWLILQKLRRAMVAPEREPLAGEVEVDEFYLGGLDEGRRGGRSRGDKTLVGVAVEARGRGSGRLRLGVLADASGDSLTRFVSATTAAGAIVHSDGWMGYSALGKLGYQHRPRSQRAAPPGEQLLPRAHRAVSNLKAWIYGTHRGVSDEHLPVYLDEYVFRHNRRGTPIAAFQTLLGLGALHEHTTYNQITRKAARPKRNQPGYAL